MVITLPCWYAGCMDPVFPPFFCHMGCGQRTLGWTLEISKNAQNREYFPVYAENTWAGVYPVISFLFCLFIFQQDEEHLVAWRVSQVQETLD